MTVASDGQAVERRARRQIRILLTTIFVAAVCALVYELQIGTASSYFLGDSITQFSLTIGIFMFAMGVGSFLSRLVRHRLVNAFVAIEVLLGVVGGLSIPVLYAAYAYTDVFRLTMIALSLLVGTLIGLEIPLITRILRQYRELRITLSNVLSLDYIGALFASVLFPFLLLPELGLVRTSLVCGIVNVLLGGLVILVYTREISRGLTVFVGTVAVGMVALFWVTDPLVQTWESHLYDDRIVYSAQSNYQKIVLTRWKNDVRLFLNGALQFAALDEARYHESLVHPAMSLPPHRRNVLILGGGDGLAAREVLKYADVEHVCLVDIDPAVTELARTHPLLVAQNKGALEDPRVEIVNADAFRFVQDDTTLYEIIICDLPDPSGQDVSKLYTREFYRLLEHRLAARGVLVTQASSPYFAPEAFWCITETLEAARYSVLPYHTYVPSFGDWGFVLALHDGVLEKEMLRLLLPEDRMAFLNETVLDSLYVFPPDMERVSVAANTLGEHKLVRYYLNNWRKW